MEKTGIIWTEHTWNIFRARNKDTQKPGWFCTKVNSGCKFCYAETLNMKFGNGLSYTIPNLKNVEFFLAATNDPFKHKEPSLFFVNSMTDTFLKEIPDSFRHQLFDIMEQTPEHEYQVLTKRPDIMYEFSLKRKLPHNMWAGMSIPDDKARINDGFEFLKKTEASLRFISAEPIVAPIHFTEEDLSHIDWIITGGESGSHLWKEEVSDDRGLVRYNRSAKKWDVRADRADWIRVIRDICIKTDTKFFHKQWGGNFPEAAGRLLDGRTWNEFPRLPGNKTHVDNDYLKHIESKIGNQYGTQDKLF